MAINEFTFFCIVFFKDCSQQEIVRFCCFYKIIHVVNAERDIAKRRAAGKPDGRFDRITMVSIEVIFVIQLIVFILFVSATQPQNWETKRKECKINKFTALDLTAGRYYVLIVCEMLCID